MLTKVVELGSVEILHDKTMQAREDTVVYEADDKGEIVELSRTYNRYVTVPGDDVSGKPQMIQDLANLLWTPEVIAEYKEKHKSPLPLPLIG